MKTLKIELTTPNKFSFWRTVYSHGWCALAPFSVNKEKLTLNRVFRLNDGTLVNCEISSSKNKQLSINIISSTKLSNNQILEVINYISECLRLKEDYSEFFKIVKTHPKYRWIAKTNSGRMLRAPTVFEDIVKMICTTNCSWSLTEIMVENLVGELGYSFNGSLKSFPTPDIIAGKTEKFMRNTIRAGYRAPFILEFADRVASGKFEPDKWRSSELSTDDLFKQLLTIKGVGKYAAGNILKLLGRYDYLGLDSWVRSKYYEIYHEGRRVSDRTIEKRYLKFSKWRGLIFWLEMTKHWFDRKFPF